VLSVILSCCCYAPVLCHVTAMLLLLCCCLLLSYVLLRHVTIMLSYSHVTVMLAIGVFIWNTFEWKFTEKYLHILNCNHNIAKLLSGTYETRDGLTHSCRMRVMFTAFSACNIIPNKHSMLSCSQWNTKCHGRFKSFGIYAEKVSNFTHFVEFGDGLTNTATKSTSLSNYCKK
jgi:hypothetical protein